jgi:hypothetical protein
MQCKEIEMTVEIYNILNSDRPLAVKKFSGTNLASILKTFATTMQKIAKDKLNSEDWEDLRFHCIRLHGDFNTVLKRGEHAGKATESGERILITDKSQLHGVNELLRMYLHCALPTVMRKD